MTPSGQCIVRWPLMMEL